MPRKKQSDATAPAPDLSMPERSREGLHTLSPAARELADLLAAVVAERLTQKNHLSKKESAEHGNET